MTFTTAITLFFSMVVLALIPGPAILLVVTRSTTAGFRHGAYTVMGIVAGDFAYITLALLGLAALAEQLGGFFILFQYAGALYLIVLGLSLLRTQAVVDEPVAPSVSNRGMSFLLGFLTTIGNPKAILFYLSFLPAFINLDAVSLKDAVVLYVAATLAVGSVLLGYAYTAAKLKVSAQKQIQKGNKSDPVISSIPVKALIRYVSCIMLVASGVYIAAVAGNEPIDGTTQTSNDQISMINSLISNEADRPKIFINKGAPQVRRYAVRLPNY